MEVKLLWAKDMELVGIADGHRISLDAKAPIGKNTGATPKELVALGMGGCTAMDVLALLKKHKQGAESLEVRVIVEPSQGKSPAVFESAIIVFEVAGGVDPAILIDCVRLSQTKYCGVNAMLSKAFPIRYRVELNGAVISEGRAHFES